MIDFSMADILPALPEIFLSGMALVLVLVAAFGGEGAQNARRVTQIAMGSIVTFCQHCLKYSCPAWRWYWCLSRHLAAKVRRMRDVLPRLRWAALLSR
jgi:hypothetical protein